MDRWIARRFSPESAVGESPENGEIRVMARTGAYLYAAGATLALLWLGLPHPAASQDLILVGILAVSYLGAGLLWYHGRKLPHWGFDLIVAAGTLLISGSIHFSGNTTPFVLFYLWSNVYAWYFLSRSRAAAQLAFIGLVYGTVLGMNDAASLEVNQGGIIPLLGPAAARWLITIGTLLVAGLLVATLRERVDRLIRGLTEERNFVSSVVETAAALVMLFGMDGRLESFNRACEITTGYDADEVRGSHISEFLLAPEELERARREWDRVLGGARAEFDSHLITRGGERRLVAWAVVLGRDAAGNPDHVIATGVDITERKRSERELRRRAQRQAAVAELGRRGLEGLSLPQLTAQSVELVAKHLRLDHCQVWEKTPYTGDLLLTSAVGAGEHEVGRLTVPAEMATQPGFTLSADGPVVVHDFAEERRFSPPAALAGQDVTSGLSVAIPGPRQPFGAIVGQTDEPRSFGHDEALFLQSIAHVLGAAIERWRSEESIRHNALHDPLTGLPNRALFLDRLTHVLARRDPRASQAAVMFLDIDNFKLVNDSLGHEAGDRLLKAVGPRLDEALRPTDTVARFGGDEFVVLCEEVGDGRDALVAADRLQHALAAPFVLEGEEHFLTASIGVALATGRYEGPDELMRDADAAMYRAKERGRAQCELFDDAMRNQVRGRLRMENALRGVIERGELRAYYQPIVSLEDGSIAGLEALMRWHHEGLGPVSPLEFIPIAEETGLIVSLGAWMMEEVCRQIVLWEQELAAPPPTVSVNLSPRQVAHAELVPTVADVLERSGLEPSRLALEITESVLINEAESPWNTLQALKKLGVTLMLDDFGTGYSSLSYLKRFPVDVLKVDRTFVDGLGCEAEDSAIVKAVVGMARALDLGVVAEGVETQRQLDCLRELGCPRAQGFLFGRPATAADTTALLGSGDARFGPLPHRSAAV
ncbi:MAG TPA: EAL domain-containing protein [Thermoleophilaceae bacterium]|jgi:diguanylate cyclase (GGDEF)-like protein/PAS domain S-box-containing protein